MKIKNRKVAVGIYILACALFMWYASFQVHAAVTVTPGSGGGSISGDRANNAITPSWITLGNIVITEGVNTDIAGAAVSNRTIILTAPAGWMFRAGSGSISYRALRDVTAASVAVTSSTITITLSLNGSLFAIDTVTVSAIQVRALTGSNIPGSGAIYRTAANGGNLNVVGLITGSTNFGLLGQITGSLAELGIIMPGQSRGGGGVGVLGTPSYIFPNVPFTITDIRAVDQFDNTVISFTSNKTLTYSGVLTNSGANTVTNPVSFTNGDATTTLTTTLRTPGVQRFVIRSGAVVTGTGSFFTVLNGSYMITAPSSFTGTISSSNAQQYMYGSLGGFTVEDQKGFTSGYTTTVQCSNLTAIGGNSISKNNIHLSGAALVLLSGSTNGSVNVDSGILSTWGTCNSPRNFIVRSFAGGSIYSIYESDLGIRVTVPGWQSIGSYTGTITYTLIEN